MFKYNQNQSFKKFGNNPEEAGNDCILDAL